MCETSISKAMTNHPLPHIVFIWYIAKVDLRNGVGKIRKFSLWENQYSCFLFLLYVTIRLTILIIQFTNICILWGRWTVIIPYSKNLLGIITRKWTKSPTCQYPLQTKSPSIKIPLWTKSPT